MIKNYNLEILEKYSEYEPKVPIRKAVDRLVQSVPEKYLSGLKKIILTNSGALNRKERREKTRWRKRKLNVSESFGSYHQEWQSEPAHIKIYVDNLLNYWPIWLLHIRFFVDTAVSDVFFHELGHHIHQTQTHEHKEKEDVAEEWSKRLSKRYMWKRYWYILGCLYPFKRLFDWLLKRYDEKSKLPSQST